MLEESDSSTSEDSSSESSEADESLSLEFSTLEKSLSFSISDSKSIMSEGFISCGDPRGSLLVSCPRESPGGALSSDRASATLFSRRGVSSDIGEQMMENQRFKYFFWGRCDEPKASSRNPGKTGTLSDTKADDLFIIR